jgi:hypothetical protein
MSRPESAGLVLRPVPFRQSMLMKPSSRSSSKQNSSNSASSRLSKSRCSMCPPESRATHGRWLRLLSRSGTLTVRLPARRDERGASFGLAHVERTMRYACAFAKVIPPHESGPNARIAKKTLDVRSQVLRSHVIPALGPKTKAVEVTAAHLRRMCDRLTEKGLSGASIRVCVSAASAMFSHGVRDLGALPRNPVRDLERGDLPSGKRTSEPWYLSEGGDRASADLPR